VDDGHPHRLPQPNVLVPPAADHDDAAAVDCARLHNPQDVVWASRSMTMGELEGMAAAALRQAPYRTSTETVATRSTLDKLWSAASTKPVSRTLTQPKQKPKSLRIASQ
jgi:hypothetical protein